MARNVAHSSGRERVRYGQHIEGDYFGGALHPYPNIARPFLTATKQTIHIKAESRTIAVLAEGRTMNVPATNRTIEQTATR
jgi:hypothetical protein